MRINAHAKQDRVVQHQIVDTHRVKFNVAPSFEQPSARWTAIISAARRTGKSWSRSQRARNTRHACPTVSTHTAGRRTGKPAYRHDAEWRWAQFRPLRCDQWLFAWQLGSAKCRIPKIIRRRVLPADPLPCLMELGTCERIEFVPFGASGISAASPQANTVKRLQPFVFTHFPRRLSKTKGLKMLLIHKPSANASRSGFRPPPSSTGA